MLPSFALRRCIPLACLAWALAFWIAGASAQVVREAPTGESTAAESSIDAAGVEFFEAKVRPLLIARCQGCHGAEKQKGNLRLDSREAALRGGDTSVAIVPGKPDKSLLVDAVRYGETYQMPPKSQLPAEEVATLVEWVRRGAPWGREQPATVESAKDAKAFDLQARAGHWSFRPLADVRPPEVRDTAWIKTPIDRFILAGLESAGLEPAPAADKRALLRRVTFDLVGLPPTPAEIEAFLADESTNAYENVVERLLASPHYGERWARHWLDLVRYAETFGHEFDYDLPNAFRYRDYVIRAINADLPYDQFVIEHVAGDLLRDPRRDPQTGFNESLIATGWFFFGEAKHSPVDVRQDEADRVDNQIDVFAKTFLGLTVSCARCHDHKFDAISTKDYYALAGYLQSSRFQQAYIDAPNSLTDCLAGLRKLREERQRVCVEYARAVLRPNLEHLASALSNREPSAALDQHLRSLVAGSRKDDPLYAWAVLTDTETGAAAEHFAARRAKLVDELRNCATAQADQSPAVESSTIESPIVIADFHEADFGDWTTTGTAFGERPGKPLDWAFGPSQGRLPGELLTASAPHSGLLSLKLQGVLRSPTFEIVKPKLWYRLYGTGGRVRLIVDGLQLIQNPIYGGLMFDAGGPQPHWHEQDVSKWVGHRAYLEVIDDGDGYIALEKVVFSETPPTSPQANRAIVEILDDANLSPAGLAEKYQSWFARALTDSLENRLGAERDKADTARVVRRIWEHLPASVSQSVPGEAAFKTQLAALDRQQQELEGRMIAPHHAPAIADGTAEDEHVFVRGSHKTLGDEVPRRFLEALGGTNHAPPAQGSGRLELARQMVSAANPLLPRVMANRIWLHHFGEGIVRSPDDFGVMGQKPTHPELLDFLASEFARQGWSLKAMHRMLVLSSTYRMLSQLRPEVERVDPQNKLWHRMLVRRLEAESIRDAILTVSGRADFSLYGASVMPYLTPYMTGRGRPTASGPLDGDGRRSIYSAVRRNFLPPLFLAFDYPIPFTTIGRRGVSNVPAQALAMMNNPLVLEQSKSWAARILSMPDRTPNERVREMYLSALGREPEQNEEQHALAFLASAGEADGGNNPQAWADLAHVLLNVKEFIFIP